MPTTGCSGRSPTTSRRSRRDGRSTRTSSTRPTPRCSTTSSSGGSTTSVFDVMPNASNTDRVRAAIGGHETTHDRAVIAVQGPTAPSAPCVVVAGRRGQVGRFRVARVRRGRRRVRRRRHRLHGRGRRRDRGARRRRRDLWEASRGAASCPPASAPATRCDSRPALPLHGHELGPGITPPAGRARLGGRLGQGRVPRPRGARGGTRARRRRACSRGVATEGRRPPRAGCAVLVDGSRVGVVTSGNYSPVLEHGIALGVPAARRRRRHRRGDRRPRRGAARPSRRRRRSSPSVEASARRCLGSGDFVAVRCRRCGADSLERFLAAGGLLGRRLLGRRSRPSLVGWARPAGGRRRAARGRRPVPERDAAEPEPNMPPADSASWPSG